MKETPKATKLREEELARIARDIAAKILEEAETKRLVKEAIDEWLSKRYERFGRWSANGILVALFGIFIIFMLWTQGYHK